MGVYIKGIKKPKHCSECTIGECRVRLPKGDINYNVHPQCPLIEIKEPHGDLIDREEVFKVIEHETLGSRWGEEIGTDEEIYIGKFKTIDDIDMIPIVIEAEGALKGVDNE